MHLVEEQWSLAYEDFFEAFKSYDEAGNSKKVWSHSALCSNTVDYLPEIPRTGQYADEVKRGPFRRSGGMHAWLNIASGLTP